VTETTVPDSSSLEQQAESDRRVQSAATRHLGDLHSFNKKGHSHVKSSIPSVVSFVLLAGALAACSGGADSNARDAATETGDASADPVVALLARPHVQDALAAAAAAGYPITTETNPNPPPIAGYYLKPLREGRFVASGNGANLTSGVAGNELRVTVHGDASVTEASVSFDDSGPFSSLVTSGLLLRGTNSDFTTYQSHTIACPIQGSDLVVEGVNIRSGRFVAANSDWELVRQINITVATSGTRTAGCDQIFTGDTEVPGGWIVAETPRYQRITVPDLEYMCVDDNAGYVAGEDWTRADTTQCSCSSYFLVECG
jgi:hypothetical protein